ncbi:MAG: DUF2577 domain-containing protein [Selenomonas ruminantium]|jgi:hypothetical protein|nr:DUF2577 domain-containing protein [Selenomonas ruminantium]
MSGANLLQTLQRMTKQTTAAGDPADWCLGEVIGVDPLTIRVEQKDVVPEEFLELTDAVRDYNVDIEVSHTTENRAGGGGYAEFAGHNHDYKGRKRITVYNGLHVGETVILLRQAGGQSFLVVSRNRDHTDLSGQWG